MEAATDNCVQPNRRRLLRATNDPRSEVAVGICHQYQCKTLALRACFAWVCTSISPDFGCVMKSTKRERWALDSRGCQKSNVDKVPTVAKDTCRLVPLHHLNFVLVLGGQPSLVICKLLVVRQKSTRRNSLGIWDVLVAPRVLEVEYFYAMVRHEAFHDVKVYRFIIYL